MHPERGQNRQIVDTATTHSIRSEGIISCCASYKGPSKLTHTINTGRGHPAESAYSIPTPPPCEDFFTGPKMPCTISNKRRLLGKSAEQQAHEHEHGAG